MGGEWRLIFGGAYFRNLGEKWWIQTTWHQGYFTGHSAESLASFSCACVQCRNYRRSFICENGMGCFVTYYSVELFAWVSHLCAVCVCQRHQWLLYHNGCSSLSEWNKSIYHAKMYVAQHDQGARELVTEWCRDFVLLTLRYITWDNTRSHAGWCFTSKWRSWMGGWLTGKM